MGRRDLGNKVWASYEKKKISIKGKKTDTTVTIAEMLEDKRLMRRYIAQDSAVAGRLLDSLNMYPLLRGYAIGFGKIYSDVYANISGMRETVRLVDLTVNNIERDLKEAKLKEEGVYYSGAMAGSHQHHHKY